MTDLAAGIKDDRLRRLYDYWDGKRGARRFPSRADIDPLDFRYVIGWVSLLDVSYDPLRFRFRLHGSEMIFKSQQDLTGKYLEDHPVPEFRAHCENAWREVIERGMPTHGFVDHSIEGQIRRFEALRLPLSGDDATIDMLLVVAVKSR